MPAPSVPHCVAPRSTARSLTLSGSAPRRLPPASVNSRAAARSVVDAAQRRCGGFVLDYEELPAGARYFAETGSDIAPDVSEAKEMREEVA